MIAFNRKILIAALTGLATLLGAGVATADTVSGSVTGVAGDGKSLAGSYTITTNANGTVTIVLTNDQTNPQSLATMLSDVSFSLSSGNNYVATNVSGSPTDGTDHLVVFTDGSGAGNIVTSVAVDWKYSGSGGNYLLTSLVGQNKTMIAGTTTSGYCGTGTAKCPDGVAGDNFNPYFQNSATFTLAITGVTDQTTISNVQLSFGTSGETVCSPSCATVPIPAAVWLFGSGLLGLIGIARRRLSVERPAAGNLSPVPA